MRVYLDCCCYNRLFDSLEQPRVKLEAEAVHQILASTHHVISSGVLNEEVAQTPDPGRRLRLAARLARAGETVAISEAVTLRGAELQRLGFKSVDALHLAAAEAGGADWLLTTDDRFLNCARRNAGAVKVPIENPSAWWLRYAQP